MNLTVDVEVQRRRNEGESKLLRAIECQRLGCGRDLSIQEEYMVEVRRWPISRGERGVGFYYFCVGCI